MAAFGPPPIGPGGPPPQGQPGAQPAGISGLVSGLPQAVPQGPTPQQAAQAYAEQVRNLHIQIDSLAQQHPEAADDLNQAKNALTNSLTKVATQSTAASGVPQPPTF